MTTQQPRHSEPRVNAELGNLLGGMLFGCQALSENTQLVVGHPGLQLDNLITAPGRAPVVVEAEYEALGTAEGGRQRSPGVAHSGRSPSHRGRHRLALPRLGAFRRRPPLRPSPRPVFPMPCCTRTAAASLNRAGCTARSRTWPI